MSAGNAAPTLTSSTPAYVINGVAATAADFYAIACDPTRSVAVEACAGAGKTWMLIERMVRALAQGAQLDEILAITFTKKAAGEMRKRLHERLAESDLCELKMQLVASGRSVQISTFHAWFAQLLRAAPLSVFQRLGLPMSYELLEDDQTLLPDLRLAFYAKVLATPDLRDDFSALIESLGRSQVDDALVSVLAKRAEFELADAKGVLEESVQDAEEKQPNREVQARAAKVLGSYKTNELREAGSSVEEGLSNENLPLLLAGLLTKEGAPKKYRSTISDEDRQIITAAQDDLLAILAAQHQHGCWQYQQRMTRISRAWLWCFAQLKRQKNVIDMADLERAGMLLLSDPELSGAVQERLDWKLRHVMIDEFQDTNPLQWQAMHAWLSSYAGSGGGQSRPSLFIVGDPKQSIYRFRRADPRVFQAAQRFMKSAFDAALLSCDHTRRSANAVLEVVNAAMLQATQADGYQGFRAHTTESEAAGAALCLPLIERTKKEKSKGADWRNSLVTPREDAEQTLKEREAEQAARWIANHAGAGSVMVLSKTHEPLHLMQQGLQRLGVAASKLEKNNLSDVPAVQDVLALLCALVSPHNDLDLARALKSPLFAWSDAQFMQLRGVQLVAMPTKKSWFDLLDGDVKTTLLRWQTWLAQMPPHDALQAMYDDGDVLAAYAKALPSAVQASAHAALQALLWAALQVDGGRFLTAYRFVRAMRAKVQSMKAPAVASSADASVVQLLTVHGAKGLEADTVLLLHSDPEPRKAQSMTTLIGWSPEESAPHAFIFLQSQSSPPASAKALLEEELRAQEIEELNSLYVAMTRARQTLVLSACEAHNSKPTTAWHRLHALCQLAGAPQASAFNTAVAAPTPVLQPRTLARLPAAVQRLPIDDEDAGAVNLAAQMGKALHRLLQWQSVDDASVAAVEREFGLSREQAQATQVRADLMLHGEAAWLWDETKLSWQANEYELFHAGRSLRIDRLVQHRTTHTWWVIDFKSATHPQRTASLREQLANYVQAVSETRGLAPTQIEAAFVTGDGRLVKCGQGGY